MNADELKQHILEEIIEARRREWVYRLALVPSKDSALYWRGYATALANLDRWVKAKLSEPALARNGALCDGGQQGAELK